MKKGLILVLLVLAVAFSATAQTIGENFEGGGAIVGGSGSFFADLDGFWFFSASPWVEFLVSDGLSVGTGVGAYVNSAGTLRFNVSPYLALYFGYDAEAESGPVHQVSVNSNVEYEISEDDSSFGIFLTPRYRFNYFFTPRIAGYLQASAVSLALVDAVDVSTYLSVQFGLSFYLPNRDIVVSNL